MNEGIRGRLSRHLFAVVLVHKGLIPSALLFLVFDVFPHVLSVCIVYLKKIYGPYNIIWTLHILLKYELLDFNILNQYILNI